MTDEQPGAGISRRAFVSSLVASGVVAGVGVALVEAPDRPARGGVAPTEDYPVVVDARPVALRRGDLLVTDQANTQIVHVHDGVATPVVAVRSWSHSYVFDAVASPDRSRLYVSMTGLNVPGDRYYFGIRGVGRVLEIDTATGRLVRMFSSHDLVDPAGLVVSPDGRTLYVSDFNSFHGNGKVHAVDLASGEMRLVSKGDLLVTPVGMNADGPHHVVVGSAHMPEVRAPGGRLVRVDLRDGSQSLVHAHPEVLGEVIAALPLPAGGYAAVRSEWPQQQQSAVFVTAGEGYRDLYNPRPGFMSSGIAWDRDGIWVGESTRRQAQKIGLDGTVLQTVNIGSDGAAKPLKRAADTLESVRVVG